MTPSILSIRSVAIGYTEPLFYIDDVALQGGKMTLLVGENGCGKTTFFQSILHQIPLLSGEIVIEGKKNTQYSPRALAQKVAMVFSKPQIPANYTVWDTVSMGKFVHYPYYFQLSKADKYEIQHIIEKLNLDTLKNTPLTQLSDGNLQKTFIGMALVQNTPLIVLDEPTTHLDQKNKMMILRVLRDIVKEMGRAVLLSSHDWQVASQFCDDIGLIENKKFYYGMAEDMLARYAYFGKQEREYCGKNFVPPVFVGSHEYEELIVQALRKYIDSDLSSFSIRACQKDMYCIAYRDEEYQTKSISEIINLIEKLIY